jgi:hypothetical protein
MTDVLPDPRATGSNDKAALLRRLAERCETMRPDSLFELEMYLKRVDRGLAVWGVMMPNPKSKAHNNTEFRCMSGRPADLVTRIE